MTISDIVDRLDTKELTILKAVADGADDLRKIRQETTLTNSAVNYRLNEKTTLEDEGLVTVERVGGRVRRDVNGQQIEMDAPKIVTITELGRMVAHEARNLMQYRYMSREELVEEVRTLRKELEEMKTQISILQRELREQG